MMTFRKFGRTQQEVSVIGHGTWGMGGMWGPREDRQAIDALVYGLERGVNFWDTAAVYGMGHSEGLIASAMREAKTRDVLIATKVPPLNGQWPGRAKDVLQAFPADHIVAQTENSLRNLRRDYVDLQQLHVWNDAWLDNLSWLSAVETLKTQGKIRFFGVSINDNDPASALKIVASGLIDSVQVIYNIFDQSPEDELFPLCQKHDVGVIVRVPFDEGSLTGALTPQTVFHAKDWRKHYFTPERLPEVCARVEKLKTLLDADSPDLPTLALQFCLNHPAVSTVIPGMRSREHVRNNCAVPQNARLAPEKIQALKAHAWRLISESRMDSQNHRQTIAPGGFWARWPRNLWHTTSFARARSKDSAGPGPWPANNTAACCRSESSKAPNHSTA